MTLSESLDIIGRMIRDIKTLQQTERNTVHWSNVEDYDALVDRHNADMEQYKEVYAELEQFIKMTGG